MAEDDFRMMEDDKGHHEAVEDIPVLEMEEVGRAELVTEAIEPPESPESPELGNHNVRVLIGMGARNICRWFECRDGSSQCRGS